VTPAEILAQAARRGVEVGLNPAGDGLRLWSDGDPPTDLVELLKGAKPELVAHLRRRAPHLRPQPDYALAFRERIRAAGDDGRAEGRAEEVRLRALESVVNLYRSHHPDADIDTAKAAVLSAIAAGEAAARLKETA
jgi:hypothetical protein